MPVGRVLFATAAVAAALVVATGCGSSSQGPAGSGNAPTVSLWLSGTTKDYRQVAGGVKLALAEAGGHAGKFRVNFAGRQLSADPSRVVVDAVGNARMSLQDTQASAVVTDAPANAARPAITLLNEAGISTVALGDDALKHEACSASSDIYPAGHATAIVVSGDAVPSDFASTFRSRLGFAPSGSAWRAYQGARAVLSSLAAPGVATKNDPPRLDRNALATALVRSHGGC